MNQIGAGRLAAVTSNDAPPASAVLIGEADGGAIELFRGKRQRGLSEAQIAVRSHIEQAGHGYHCSSDYRDVVETLMACGCSGQAFGCSEGADSDWLSTIEDRLLSQADRDRDHRPTSKVRPRLDSSHPQSFLSTRQ